MGTSLESADTGVPAYLSDCTSEQQEVFSTSPFATLLREKQGPEEEEDLHAESKSATRSPWGDAFDPSLVSFQEFDILCLLIPPTIVPERIPICDDDNNCDDTYDIRKPRNRSLLTLHHSYPDSHSGSKKFGFLFLFFFFSSVRNHIILLIFPIHLMPDRARYVEYSARYSDSNF